MCIQYDSSTLISPEAIHQELDGPKRRVGGKQKQRVGERRGRGCIPRCGRKTEKLDRLSCSTNRVSRESPARPRLCAISHFEVRLGFLEILWFFFFSQTGLRIVLDAEIDEYLPLSTEVGITVMIHEPGVESDYSRNAIRIPPGVATYLRIAKAGHAALFFLILCTSSVSA